MNLLDEMAAKLGLLPEDERAAVLEPAYQATANMPWISNPGAQTEAYFCQAHELFFGGNAGGGKTDLLLGTALTAHRRSLILRRLNTEVSGLYERMEEILGTRKGLTTSPKALWRLKNPDRLIYFGGVQHLDDRVRYQGIPKDFIGFDEVSNFLEAQYEFIIGWARSTVPGQRVRVIAAGNPPTTPEGMWVVKRWGPWLDKKHPNPALPGELRWFTTIDGADTEVDGPGPVVIDGKPLLDKFGDPILPKSRTFIPADLNDNPDLKESGYAATLAALPGPLRAAMFEGDFSASQHDDAWQVFPSEWVEQAMQRWSPEGARAPMTVLGVDIAQGGPDRTVLAARHGNWFDQLKSYPGTETPDGPTVAGLIFMTMRNQCEIIIDMGGGWGGSTRDHLKQSFSPTLFLGSAALEGRRDRTGTFKFFNVRAGAAWHLREALDPSYGAYIALPPDPELKAELVAMRYSMRGDKLLIEPKEDMKKRIGISPDKADAVIMAHFATGRTNASTYGSGSLPSRAITSGRKPGR